MYRIDHWSVGLSSTPYIMQRETFASRDAMTAALNMLRERSSAAGAIIRDTAYGITRATYDDGAMTIYAYGRE